MHMLSIDEIEKLTSHRGVSRAEAKNFLETVGRVGSLDSELLNLYYDARSYNWNISTVRAIEEGIRLAHEDETLRQDPISTNVKAVIKSGRKSSKSMASIVK
jgi:hypothetical protein